MCVKYNEVHCLYEKIVILQDAILSIITMLVVQITFT